MVAEDRELLVLNPGSEDDSEDREINTEDVSRKEDEDTCLSLVHVSALVAAIGGLLFGYDVGIISGAKLQVAHDLDLSCAQEELLVGLMPLGALSSSIVAGRCLSNLGRKRTIQVTAVIFTVGAFLMASAIGLVQLLVGRFVVGFAVSLSAMAECIYISEISNADNRGLLVSFNELGITLGFLIAYIVNYIFMMVDGGWRYMFSISIILSTIQLLALVMLPMTPHFLIMKKREADAAVVLRKIRGENFDVRREITAIRTSYEQIEDNSCASLFGTENNMRGRLGVALGLVIFQQLTGQPNILYYATDVFEAVGFCGDSMAALAAVGLGLVKVAATLMSLCLVDKMGRKTLLLGGISCMAISLLCLTVFAGYQSRMTGGLVQHQTCYHHNSSQEHVSVFLQYNVSDVTSVPQCEDNPLPPALRYVAFVAIVIFVAAYSLSFGPITWIILSEIFPLGQKGKAMSLGQAVNWTANVFVSVTFLDAVRIFSLPAIFLFYLCMSILALIFILEYVPETRNKTLEQISLDLQKSSRTGGGCSLCCFVSKRRNQSVKQFVRLKEDLATEAL